MIFNALTTTNTTPVTIRASRPSDSKGPPAQEPDAAQGRKNSMPESVNERGNQADEPDESIDEEQDGRDRGCGSVHV